MVRVRGADGSRASTGAPVRSRAVGATVRTPARDRSGVPAGCSTVILEKPS